MEIVKRLITLGANDVNAVLLNDEGEEYPVFLESLHNTVVFPILMESGYTLTKLPYGFVKDGVSFDDLPIEEYTCTEIEEELMYNSIGVKMSYEEIKSHVTVTAENTEGPATAYTIFTREDLIKYLLATESASVDEDYMPLNYFVAPEARFSIMEYKDPANLRYIQLISARREMSLAKFDKLVSTLLKINLPANYTAMDVLDSYFAWGVDGLNMSIVSRRRDSRPFRLTTNRNLKSPVINRTYGLVDGAGNLLLPQNQKELKWKLTNKDPNYVSQLTANMQLNDTAVVEFSTGAKQEVTILEGTEFNVQYSEEMLVMQLQSYPSIRVKSPAGINEFLDLKLAAPNNREALYEHCITEALARMAYAIRKPNVRVSSYDALKVAGCNPRTVLEYIVTKYDMSKESQVMMEDAAPRILDFDIENYLEGSTVSDDIKTFFEDVILGVFNIDEIAQGKKAESSVNTTSVYREIYAMHHVMGIGYQEIYNRLAAVTPEQRSIIFSNDGLNHTMNVSQLTYSITGYKHDLMNYDLMNARDCTFFTYVYLIAREVGDERANKHVGIEFYLVNKRHKEVKEILDELVTRYEDKVTSSIPDVTRQASQMRLVNMFALSRYFEIALKGTITWPVVLGGNVEPAMPSMVTTARKYLERKIENITAYCSFTANTSSSKNLTFNAYCTNAYITPEYVIPRSDAPIREIPFYSAWFDWRSQNPGVWEQLVSNSVIPADFQSWDSRYASEQFVQRDLCDLDASDSLLYYYNHAVEEVKSYPDNKDFIAVHHPSDYMFPGVFTGNEDFEDCDTLSMPRQGDPVVRLGYCRNITKENYEDKLLPSDEVLTKDSYIRPYQGFDAKTFIMVPDVFSKIPAQKERTITVMAKSETVYVEDTQQVINFRRIVELDMSKYAISHICDRMYLLREANGSLWEVVI